jgi:hypothetical protein
MAIETTDIETIDIEMIHAIAFGTTTAEDRLRTTSAMAIDKRLLAAGIRRGKGPVYRDDRICLLRKSGIKIKKIAELFNLTTARIYQISSN